MIADGGNPSPVGQGAHAGTLSFEMSVGKQRIIVNCSAYAGRDSTWRLAQRATAAHSTLIVEDRNSTEVREDGAIGANGVTVTSGTTGSGRQHVDRHVHDGYVASHDVVHGRRSLYQRISSDIRGEDSRIW